MRHGQTDSSPSHTATAHAAPAHTAVLSDLDPARHIFSPKELATFLGQKYSPTPQQEAIIAADPHGSILVTAGAGAGKTETMAARVVWLVANGYVLPEQVLGLTFTKKAASELGVRIRKRLETLAHSSFIDQLPKDDLRRNVLATIYPSVATYDSYVGSIAREYGLLIPIEPSLRIINAAERWMIARDVVLGWSGQLRIKNQAATVIQDILSLSDEMDNHLVSIAEVEEETRAAKEDLEQLPLSRGKRSSDNEKFLAAQQARLDLLPLVQAFRDRLDELHVMTFGQQMSKVAQLVLAHPRVGRQQRRRFRVVLLDEYQDTGHAQRIMLRTLYGQGIDPQLSITAVGDPMQSIYLFRGATASNLQKFREDFPLEDGSPSHKLELTTSWRNPAGVLELANAVSDWSMDTGRSVSALEPSPQAQRGEISLSFFDNELQEIQWLAQNMATYWQDYQNSSQQKAFSAAVLITRNSQALPIYQALTELGVPAEMEAGPGLLDIPEVAEVYATLRVLVDPDDDVALLRLLTGSRWNLGAADLAVLSRRARQLHRRSRPHGREPEGMASASAAGIFSSAPLPESLRHTLDRLIPDPQEITVGLAEALADFSDAEQQGMTPEGAARINELARELGQLRRHSLSKSLPDVITDIEQMIGVRTEVMARWFRDPNTAIATSHLEKFAEVVRTFAQLPGANPSTLVEYLRAAYEAESGLEPGEVIKKPNTVQILTVHKAKGLEWDIVAVPFANRRNFSDAAQPSKEESWTTRAPRIPTHLRGDAADEDGEGIPVLDLAAVEKSSDHSKAEKALKEKLNQYASKERDRVFYVAITRTMRVLMVSAAALSTERKTATDPSVMLKLLEQRARPEEVKTFSPLGHVYKNTVYRGTAAAELSREDKLLLPSPEINERRAEEQTAWAEALKDGDILAAEAGKNANPADHAWPQHRAVIPGRDLAGGAAMVFEAMKYKPAAGTEETRSAHSGRSELSEPSELSGSSVLSEPSKPAQHGEHSIANHSIQPSGHSQWNLETDLLIEEHLRKANPEVQVPLGVRLTATEAVSMRRDEEEFARRRRRPVPLQPQPYAKRGTAFHNWVEQRFGTVGLLDEDQLPGASDATMQDPELEKLKTAFLASQWANRQPYSVEGAYSVTLGNHIFEGRIDAVYHEGEDPTCGWLVVDWKTGPKPTGEAMRAAEIQLGVYRLAWAKVLSRTLGETVEPEGVRAAFHYVKTNETVEPRTLPTAEQLVELMHR